MDFDSIIARWQTRKSLTGFGVDQFLALVDTMANRPMAPDVLIMHPDLYLDMVRGLCEAETHECINRDTIQVVTSTPSEGPGVFYTLFEDAVSDRAGLTEILTAPAPELIPITGKDLHPNDFRDLWEYMTGGGQ